jgi:hypothetical protein
MSTDGIDALLREREELLAQVQGLQSAILHIVRRWPSLAMAKAVWLDASPMAN